jgi:hypothetical protein
LILQRRQGAAARWCGIDGMGLEHRRRD